MSTLRANVRVNIEEPTAATWSNANIDSYINAGVQDLNRRSQLLVNETPGTITFVANQTYYSLASDCAGPHRLLRVQKSDGTEIFPMIFSAFHYADVDPKDDTHTSGGTPSRWYQCGRKIGFYPKPNYAADDIIEYWYITTPTTLSDDADTSPFSDEEDDLIEYYASFRCYLQAQDMQKATLWRGLYMEGVTEFAGHVASYRAGEPVPLEGMDKVRGGFTRTR